MKDQSDALPALANLAPKATAIGSGTAVLFGSEWLANNYTWAVGVFMGLIGIVIQLYMAYLRREELNMKRDRYADLRRTHSHEATDPADLS